MPSNIFEIICFLYQCVNNCLWIVLTYQIIYERMKSINGFILLINYILSYITVIYGCVIESPVVIIMSIISIIMISVFFGLKVKYEYEIYFLKSKYDNYQEIV